MPGLPSKAWSCHEMVTCKVSTAPFWMKHRAKIWGTVGEDGRGWYSESGCRVG